MAQKSMSSSDSQSLISNGDLTRNSVKSSRITIFVQSIQLSKASSLTFSIEDDWPIKIIQHSRGMQSLNLRYGLSIGCHEEGFCESDYQGII